MSAVLSIAVAIIGFIEVVGDPSSSLTMILGSPFAVFGFVYLYCYLFCRIFKIVGCFLGPLIAFVVALAGSMTLLLAPFQAVGSESVRNAIAIVYAVVSFGLLFVQIRAFLRQRKNL